jgi:hypothetical protein
MKINVFCRCSLFSSWSGLGLISTPVKFQKNILFVSSPVLLSLMCTHVLPSSESLRNYASLRGTRQQGSEDLQLYSSPNALRVVISRRFRRTGHIVCMGKRKCAYRVLVGKCEGIRPRGWPRRRWEDSIKMDLHEVGWRVWTRSIWLRMGTVAGSCECGNELSGAIKCEEFLY